MDLPPEAPTEADPTPPAEPPPPPALPRRIRRRSAMTAGILGWVVPGLGQVYAGRPGKGLLLATTVGALFYAGWAMTGFTAVNPHEYGLEFVAHAWLGGPTAWAYWSTRGLELSQAMPYFEVGRLYAAVAGLLNIVAICDALGCVLEHNVKAEDREAERTRLEQTYRAMLDRFEAARAPASPDVPLSLDMEGSA